MPSFKAGFKGTTPNIKLSLRNSSTLVKATLIPWDQGVPPIEFMFNPTELAFEGVVETAENPGARTEKKGQPKVSFSHVKAYTITINKIVFDTYEDGENVVEKYIEPLKTAVRFVGSDSKSSLVALNGLPEPPKAVSEGLNKLSGAMDKLSNALGGGPKKDQRPPMYRFVWGDQVYLRRCFVEKLNYKLTMFLPDGTPVRATVDSLKLKEADEQPANESLQNAVIDRVKDGLGARLNAKGSFKL